VWNVLQGRPLRTFRGHIGPVTAICDCLLGVQDGSPTLASGGIDGTIRLWALVSGQKRGQPPLKKTIHAHGLAVKQLVVPE
jgi:WD40 repeat protein